MTNDELKERLIRVLQEGAVRGGISRTTSYDEERENGVLVGIIPTHTEVEINFGVFSDALIAAGLRFGENLTATFDHMALEREHELERGLAEATKAMYVYERALYYATLNGETADEVKYNDALKRAQKDFAKNKGD